MRELDELRRDNIQASIGPWSTSEHEYTGRPGTIVTHVFTGWYFVPVASPHNEGDLHNFTLCMIHAQLVFVTWCPVRESKSSLRRIFCWSMYWYSGFLFSSGLCLFSLPSCCGCVFVFVIRAKRVSN